MADSIAERIIQAMAAALAGPGAPAGLAVSRSRLRPTEAAQLPAISILPVHEDVERATTSRLSPVVRRTLKVHVLCRAAGDPPDAALDALRQWAIAAIQADPSLGGLALGVAETGTDWELEEAGDGAYGLATIELEVKHATSVSNLAVFA